MDRVVPVMDVRANQLLRLLNRLEETVAMLRSWPKQRLADSAAGGRPGPGVPINVGAMDLADEVHGVLVSWCEQVAEERGEDGPDPRWSTWACSPSGSWYATGGNTSLVIEWLRPRAAWMCAAPWYREEAFRELVELTRRVDRMLGLSVPSRSKMEAAIVMAAAAYRSGGE